MLSLVGGKEDSTCTQHGNSLAAAPGEYENGSIASRSQSKSSHLRPGRARGSCGVVLHLRRGEHPGEWYDVSKVSSAPRPGPAGLADLSTAWRAECRNAAVLAAFNRQQPPHEPPSAPPPATRWSCWRPRLFRVWGAFVLGRRCDMQIAWRQAEVPRYKEFVQRGSANPAIRAAKSKRKGTFLTPISPRPPVSSRPRPR